MPAGSIKTPWMSLLHCGFSLTVLPQKGWTASIAASVWIYSVSRKRGRPVKVDRVWTRCFQGHTIVKDEVKVHADEKGLIILYSKKSKHQKGIYHQD